MIRVSFQVVLMASAWWFPSSTAFLGIRTHERIATEGVRRCHSFRPAAITAKKDDDDDEGEEDPLLNDQREGMADAFSALDSLTADDFDDFRPLTSTDSSISDGLSMEDSAKLFMEMSAELSTRGEEGVYDDVLGDLTGESSTDSDVPTSYLKTDDGDVTGGLVNALDEAADLLSADPPPVAETSSSVLNDTDGLGTDESSSTETPTTQLTTADVTKDILTQKIKPSLSMEDFMSSAIQEAVTEIRSSERISSDDSLSPSEPGRTGDIAKTAEQLLEDDDLRKEIGEIFDRAGEKLRKEVEVMKKEQEAVTQSASKRGLEYLESERQRISEAEQSVTRLIQKVADETEEVEKAMENLELAKNEASGGQGGSIEDTALDLKKGGLIKQASLVGGLLFGSRAVTETILVLTSPYGDEHFVSAIVQAAIALACAAYFFLVK